MLHENYFVFLTVFILSSFTLHKFYVSTTSIKFIPDDRSLQITAQVFADDFEFALKKMASGIKLNPDNDADLVDSLKNIFKKLTNVIFIQKNRLIITVNEKINALEEVAIITMMLKNFLI